MNYYSFNISDFGYATRHLSLIEKAIYRELLDLYYDKESPLENNLQKLSKLICAQDYLTDVEQVLSEFFELENDVWIHSTCERIIADYHDKVDKASKAGKASARARAKKSKASSDVTDVEQTLNRRATNQEPRTKNQEPIPYSTIVEVYNSEFANNSGNSQVAKLTSKRKSLVKTSWNFDTDNKNEKLHTNNIDYWKRYFAHCATIEFFQANAVRAEGHKTWKPDFEFIIKPDTQVKVREGKYQ
jgi:uncharacterized protein YdaU (DUF1376 family)